VGVTAGLALLLLALLLVLWAARLRQQTGLPWAPVVYQDTAARTLEKPLFEMEDV